MLLPKNFYCSVSFKQTNKNLEDEIGFCVLIDPKKIKLTPAGLVLYKSLKNHLENFNNSIELAKRISEGEDRSIKISHSSSIIFDQKVADFR